MNAGVKSARATGDTGTEMLERREQIMDKPLDAAMQRVQELTKQSLSWTQNFVDAMHTCNAVPDTSKSRFVAYSVPVEMEATLYEQIPHILPGKDAALLIIYDQDASRILVQVVAESLATTSLKLRENGERSNFYNQRHPNGFHDHTAQEAE